MKYTIIGSLRSPFVRACRMLMVQHSIECDFRILNFVDDRADAEALSKETPINKVPILVVGDQKIFDSRVIQNYLTKKHGLRTLSLDEENLLTAIYSCLDTGVLLFLMKNSGMDIEGPGFFLNRQRARIPDNLAYVTPWAKKLDPSKPEDWNFVSMSLYSFLYWGERRTGLFKVSDYHELEKFMERFQNAPGVHETGF